MQTIVFPLDFPLATTDRHYDNFKFSRIISQFQAEVNDSEIVFDSTTAIDEKPIFLNGFSSDTSVDNERFQNTDSTLHVDNADTVPTILHRNPRKRSLKELQSRVNKVKSQSEFVNESPKEQPSEHEFDIFGRSVGAQLKAMSLVKALQAQQHIQNYITSLRLQQLTNSEYDDPLYSTSPSAST